MIRGRRLYSNKNLEKVTFLLHLLEQTSCYRSNNAAVIVNVDVCEFQKKDDEDDVRDAVAALKKRKTAESEDHGHSHGHR